MRRELPRPDPLDTPEMWSAIEARIRHRAATISPAAPTSRPGRLQILTARLTPATGVLAVVVALMVSVSTLQTPGILAPTTTTPSPVAHSQSNPGRDSIEMAVVPASAHSPVPQPALAAHLPEADAIAIRSEMRSDPPPLATQRFR